MGRHIVRTDFIFQEKEREFFLGFELVLFVLGFFSMLVGVGIFWFGFFFLFCFGGFFFFQN